MPASENRGSLSQSTNDGVYVKTDLYPSSTLDDGCVRDDGRHHHDHDDDQPPVLKIARYAISPSPILSSNHQNGYAFDSHLTSPIPRRKQVNCYARDEFIEILLFVHFLFVCTDLYICHF